MLIRMRLGVIADIHGNEVALRAILEDAEQMAVDRWWALGDLVLFGPRPVEVLDLLSALPGIEPEISEERLGDLLAGCDADLVIGGHTHWITDRFVGGVRTLNPGSAGLPDPPGATGWLLIEDDGHGPVVTQRTVPFDAGVVIDDLQERHHPNTDFTASILSGRRRRADKRVGS